MAREEIEALSTPAETCDECGGGSCPGVDGGKHDYKCSLAEQNVVGP